MSYLCTNCVSEAILVLLSVSCFIQLFRFSVSPWIAFSGQRAQYIQNVTVISALVRNTWYLILALERIIIRYHIIRRRYCYCQFCSARARASPIVFAALKRLNLQFGFVFLLQFVGYCSCPWALPASCTFGKHGMDSIIEQIGVNIGIDVRRSFLTVPDRKFIVSNMELVSCETDNAHMKITNAEMANTVVQAELLENWNVTAILCGDGESHLPSESFFGACLLDGAIFSFWIFFWDSLVISWAPK